MANKLHTCLTFLLLLVVSSFCRAQQPDFKVYISADMEGVAGVVEDAQCGPEGSDYPFFRNLMIGEVNAAIGAAFEAGASDVVVADSHGRGVTLQPDRIDRRASLITGAPKPWGMMQGLDAKRFLLLTCRTRITSFPPSISSTMLLPATFPCGVIPRCACEQLL